MEQYYITTLTNAFKNLAPWFIFIVGGYFVFFKLPFLFLKKNMIDQKKKIQEEMKDVVVTETKEKVAATVKEKEAPKLRVLPQVESKKPEQRERPKQEQKKEQKKEEPKRASPSTPSPEEILGLKPNEPFTQSELKKRYFELLKQNHPDRVASMGPDFKKLAEKNTKDINRAYDRLKSKKAS